MGSYDFIVVGSGPAGASLAALLARTEKVPQVLLLEAGGAAGAKDTRLLFDRFTSFMTQPHSNYGYKTVPQPQLDNREVEYSRGKGLGGSTVINFACYTVGPSDDYDEWARLVGDERFEWKNAKERYRRIETVHRPTQDAVKKYVEVDEKAHGTDGPLSVEWSDVFEQEVTTLMDVVPEMDWGYTKDMNSGNPVGVGVTPNTAYKGLRTTSASVWLEDMPKNLTIKTKGQVHKVLVEDGRAVGVLLVNGDKYLASKEVILSAGTLDTPKILLLSGIGPPSELSKHSIPQVAFVPGVGQNLQDHALIMLAASQKPGTSQRPSTLANAQTASAARAQFLESGTGPFSYMIHSVIFGWLKHTPLFIWPEFLSLPSRTQSHLRKPTVPHWEFIGPGITLHPAADSNSSYVSVMTASMNPQSVGSVTLNSADPRDPPRCDPKLLSHPFDRKMFIFQVREAMRALTHTSLRETLAAPFAWPEVSDPEKDAWECEDAAIERYINANAGTEWHMSGTCKMGDESDESVVVDTRFRVKGVKGLRVVDLSVCPFVMNCHTVAVAYNVGVAGADVLREDYGLDDT